MRRGVLRIVLLCGVLLPLFVTAQIRTIPQALRDSVNNPATVKASPMHFAAGEQLEFGTLNEESAPWQGVAQWRNTGASPLVVTRIASSCGCLRAEFDRKPVAAGEEAEVRVTYHPKGHPGTVYQRLFVYTNRSSSRPTAILVVRGVVTPSRQVAATYPFSMGALRLRTKEAVLRAGEQEVRLACKNGGQRALRMTIDTLLSPQGWQISTDPRVLEAGAEGDLVIRRIPDAPSTPTATLYVSGVQLPPRQRALQISVEE